jgi:hypothetical protein
MGLGAVIYVPSFMKTGSGIQKLMGGGTQTDLISLLLFFQNNEIRLKIDIREVCYEDINFTEMAGLCGHTDRPPTS